MKRYLNIRGCGVPYYGKGVIIMTLLLISTCSFKMAGPQMEEYSIKAAFIYKFTNYIEWGSSAAGNEFVIGIAGSCPIRAELAEIARDKTIGNKKIVIKQFNTSDEIGTCHILFIPAESNIRLTDILAKTHGKGVLTVSEKEGYAAKGTGINFVEVENRLKFEANPKVISSEGLKASSQLLKLAIIVD